jgi:hypothetical protein
MSYTRPVNASPVTPDEKPQLISDHVAYYEKIALLATERRDYSELNVKLPKVAAEALLSDVGALLNQAALKAAKTGQVKDFLDRNPLPVSMKSHLPDEFRAFCLLLNSLKQWVSAESLATDRYLLGGTVRDKLRAASSRCMITGSPLDKVELHHAVSDGRPPIPLSSEGHRQVEESNAGTTDVPLILTLRELKAERTWSWKMLRDGCMSQLGEHIESRSKNALNTSRTFAKKAQIRTGLSFEQLLESLDESGLGL